MFNKKTVKDVNLSGERVLLRADYNVPVEKGRVIDDYRIRKSLPTIKYILQQKPVCLIIISHLGRPKDNPKAPFKQFSLEPVAKDLSRLLDRKVEFAGDCIGEEVSRQIDELPQGGGIILLENVRFHEGEEANDPKFAKALVETTKANVFIQDGFGVVHRAHATTDAITKLLPSFAGLLLENEVSTISKVMEKPERPFLAIMGGAKIADKIELLERFIKSADALAVGGAMANNFLLAEGHGIGGSLYDKADMEETRRILKAAKAEAGKRPFAFILPVDVVVSKSIDGKSSTRIVDVASHSLADAQSYPKMPPPAAYTVAKNEAVYDIGPISAGRIAGAVELARTVVWNGTLGVTEAKGLAGAHPPFAHASRTVAEAIIGPHNKHPNRPFSLIGGGDTAAYIEQEGLVDDFDHVSTGGGASLELMAGKKLPGVEALLDK